MRRKQETDELVSKKRRRRRPGLPATLTRSGADEMAKRRCVMLLQVLSGETSISQAIADAQISSALYYQLEAKALMAMLGALSPDDSADERRASQSRTVEELQARTKRLEQDKRRLERLLSMTRKVLKPGPMKQAHLGRPRSRRSKRSPKPPKVVDMEIERDQASTPTPVGADAP